MHYGNHAQAFLTILIFVSLVNAVQFHYLTRAVLSLSQPCDSDPKVASVLQLKFEESKMKHAERQITIQGIQ